jgi:NTP pyrophosphatase (non-canonical NTP hydrolase)
MTCSPDRLVNLQDAIRAFVAERDWLRYHDPKNLSMALAAEAGELLAEYRWVHSDDSLDHTDHPDHARRVREEVGDIAITLLCLCDRLGLDFVETASAKLTLNAHNYPVETSHGRPERPQSGSMNPPS